MTFRVRSRRAVDLTGPDEPVGFGRMEVDDGDTETVGIGGRGEGVPLLAGVGGVVDFLGGGDEVGSIFGEGVNGESEEHFGGVELLPGETFVGGLPDGVVAELDEEGLEGKKRTGRVSGRQESESKRRTCRAHLRVAEVDVLNDGGSEVVLRKSKKGQHIDQDTSEIERLTV